MGPVLEHLPRAPQPGIQHSAVIAPQPGEEGHVVGATEDVHRVELDQTDSVHHPAEVPHVDPASGGRVVEALGGQGETASLIDGEGAHGEQPNLFSGQPPSSSMPSSPS